jgi:hypothetical protein
MTMLRQHASDLHGLPHAQRFLGIRFPTRMGVVRLPDGGVWLWSPVPLDVAAARAVEALGPVRHIVAPNRFHHVNVGPAQARFPDARVFAAPGLERKRKDLTFDDVLGDAPPAAWGGVFEQVLLRAAPTFHEVVFFHRPTGTVFAADLFLNVRETESWLERLYFGLEGCHGRLAVPRLMHLITRDRAEMRADLARIASWPIQRVFVSHGEVVEENAAEAVARALQRFLGAGALPAPAGG